MKRLSHFVDVLMLAGFAVVLAAGSGLAAPPPPPPPPAVPTGDVMAQFAAGGGIAAYGAWRLWKAKRASKGSEKE